MNTGKLFQKFLGVLFILLGVLSLKICSDGTGVICVIFPIGLWLLLTKEQLIGDDPRES